MAVGCSSVLFRVGIDWPRVAANVIDSVAVPMVHGNAPRSWSNVNDGLAYPSRHLASIVIFYREVTQPS